jgi:ring-1,2-phenylacetyl-CoA epoxidase subunit PaaD
MAALIRPTVEQAWSWLGNVSDPEIPVISVVDLGIVRDVRWSDAGNDDGSLHDELVVTITPTYSGCPAIRVIAQEIENALRARGIEHVRLERRLSPPWTTDWITAEGRRRLTAYGIAPPVRAAGGALSRLRGPAPPVSCPRCGSAETFRVSEFGSTPCKAQWQCRSCLEPFDYFKCI